MAHTHHHHHHHARDHGHQLGSDLGQKNQNHFDNVAATMFDTPWIRDLANQISRELHDQVKWIGFRKSEDKTKMPTKMLDYACGNGVASRALASHLTMFRGIDISPNMAEQYNIIARKEGFSEERMRAVQGDLLDSTASPSAELDSEEFCNFDLIVLSMALHHVEEPQDLVRKLSERLAQGGVLLIIDWAIAPKTGLSAPQVTADHPASHTVTRMGFQESDMKGYFENVGLTPDWKLFSSTSRIPEEYGGEKQLFLAKGTRL